MTDNARPSPTAQTLLAAGTALHHELQRQVHTLRLAGATWKQVGAFLGVTRQAAHERWRYLDDFGVQIVKRDGRATIESPQTGAVLDRLDLAIEGADRFAALGARLNRQALSA